MGDMREAFDALKEANKERKANNYTKNIDVIKNCGIEYRQDQNGTVIFKTTQGTVCFYPTTNKFALKRKVYYGKANSVISFIKNMTKQQAS